MNKDLIEKLITSNNEQCPEFTHENPLMDKNVAKTLSRSFIKILNISIGNTNVNNNLRLSILENLRRMCQLEPVNHLKVDDNVTQLLINVYQQQLKESQNVNINTTASKELEAYFLRCKKHLNINSKYEPTLNPEVIQALLNLNDNKIYLETLAKDVIHWNTRNKCYLNVIKGLWENNNSIVDLSTMSNMFDDISIKMKPEIERILLEFCHNILLNRNIGIDTEMLSNEQLKNLMDKCSLSAECFQVSCGVLNFIFMMSNFDTQMQTLIPLFIKYIKEHCTKLTFTVLYPIHISNIALLLDFDINALPLSSRKIYIEPTIKQLKELHEQSENELILLLSHFPQWFDIYFSS